jgi:hypothetical protein
MTLTFMGIATEGHAQQLSGPSAPVNIPLYYYFDPTNPLLSNQAKLAINVGINGGAPKPYIFDTGSPVFNAAYNAAWWPAFPPPLLTNGAPISTVMSPDGTPMNNAQFCYGGSTLPPKATNQTFYCRGWTGNLVQVTSLGFHQQNEKGVIDPTAFSKLEASPGYVVNAGYFYGAEGGVFTPYPFEQPPMYGHFFGVFGAGDFVTNVFRVEMPEALQGRKESNYWAGGVLGQTTVSGVMAQGYMVAANGQKNPLSDVNGPQQVNGINVTIGGHRQPITPCSPCVTVGLTPAMLGQFWAKPTPAENAGVIPWAETAENKKGEKEPFQNPYDPGSAGNNASTERGTNYKTTLTAPDGTIKETSLGLLDTGTGSLNLESTASPHQINQVSNSGNDCLNADKGCAVNAGVKLTIAGATPEGEAIPGLTTTHMTVTKDNDPQGSYGQTYDTQLKGAAANQNTIGISFFT